MKKLGALVPVLVLALALSSQALAGGGKTEKLHGTIKGGGKIEVDVKLKKQKVNGEMKFVVNGISKVVLTAVPFRCDDSTTGTANATIEDVAKSGATSYAVGDSPVPGGPAAGTINGKFPTKFGTKFTGRAEVSLIRDAPGRDSPTFCNGGSDFTAK
jgi:hypothetical protein